jgi:hypothetical protein
MLAGILRRMEQKKGCDHIAPTDTIQATLVPQGPKGKR